MVGELFKLKAGMNMLHVGYRGGGAAILDLLAGHVKVGSMTLSTTIQHIRAGSLVPLALSSAKRVADLPDVPTFTELGYPEIVSTTWFSLSGPAGLPREVTDKLNKAVLASLGDQDVEKRLAQEEVQIEPMTPVEITKFMQSERSRWEPVLKIVGGHN
jgi:tripartite-type tricarboxylate transporter receptor subunit TctC